MKSKLTQSLTLLVCSATIATTSPAATDQPYELEPMQVRTASRSSEDLSASLAAVSVISAEDIRRSAAEDLFELLRLEAGIDIVRTGGPGQQTSVFMRGGNSNHTLVLIDGIRVSSAHTGAYAWEHLPLNQVERVEIVRGPRGSMYGSDAIGGVIQVFTRDVDAPFARVTAGSHASGELETGTGFRWGEVRISLSAGLRDSDGYSAQNPDGFSFHPDDDGFNSRNLNISGTGDAGPGSWQFRVTAIENELDFDQGTSRSEQVLASASLSGAWRDAWQYRWYAGWNDDRLDSDFEFFATHFDSRRLDLGWENRLQIGEGSLGFGLDHYAEEGQSAESYAGDRHNSGLFALWEQPFAAARLQLSGRWDHNSLFGSELTHQAAIRFAAGDRGELVLSRGTAFRAPTLSEQYSPGFGGLFAGNPDLKPESSDSTELIYRLETGPGSALGLSIFRTRVEGLIAFTGPDFQAVNVNQAGLDGIEANYELRRASWALKTNATFQDSKDLDSGLSLLRRPERKGSLRYTQDLAEGSWVSAEWFVSGDRLDVASQKLPGYALLNLSAGYTLAPAWRLEARVDNLLDRRFEPARGFNGTARAAFVSLSWAR
jgi:vitamin B12 transporter